MSLHPYEKSYLLDVVYGIEPMVLNLALDIKSLRVGSRCQYELIARSLNDGFNIDYSLGEGLCALAKKFLREEEAKEWLQKPLPVDAKHPVIVEIHERKKAGQEFLITTGSNLFKGLSLQTESCQSLLRVLFPVMPEGA